MRFHVVMGKRVPSEKDKNVYLLLTLERVPQAAFLACNELQTHFVILSCDG